MAGQPALRGLKDKVALVTGAGSGIGRASAQRLAAEGALVAVADIDGERAQETVAMIRDAGNTARAFSADVSVADDVERLIASVVDGFGRIDIAHNNAGILLDRHPMLVDTTEAEWDRIMSVNLKGVWLCLRAELRIMATAGRGVIVNSSSAAALRAGPGGSAYATTKAGIIMLTKTAAVEHASQGIRVNAIAPGMVRTPPLDDAFTRDPEFAQRMTQMTPMQRISDPAEIAAVVAWLASDDASYMTGTTVIADGGAVA
ncbi:MULTISPECIES: SDR family NAD(P)-dependent oxidoreductase [Streptomyces]|uniref:SDR family NAD(P)-dependent oxidoreductase n=1 Tax=Streptomyces lycopersici TaxID=2974589 RepID=UPI0021CFC3FE|nr:glucose 1-dehydrogenase [Streptomyces sp. NEAU-383]